MKDFILTLSAARLRIYVRAISALLGVTVASLAFAQAPEPAGRPQDKARVDQRFKAADKDGDGALTRDEAQRGMPALHRVFDQVDANKDGKVTRAELEAAFQARARRQYQEFENIDSNRDGVVTYEELVKRASSTSRVLGRLYADKDERITRQELDGFVQRRYYQDFGNEVTPNVLIRGRF